MQKIQITTEYIQLNQLLKLLGVAENGSEANTFIQSSLVKVDGQVEMQKRKKIYPGMTIEFDEETYQVEL